MSAPNSSVYPPHSNPSSVPGAPANISSTPAPNNTAGSSNAVSAPLLSPSSHSTAPRLRPSNSASASRSTTTPPTTITASSATGAQPRVTMDLNPALPSRTTQLHIDEARAALVASMSNMLDSELQSRASLLHSNAAALTKQEKDVIKGTEALRKENDKLEKLARDTERKIKELGNVQNWAEVLERDFLILEETARLVKNGSGSDSCSECSRSSWSGSYSADDSRAGSRRGSVTGDADVNGKKPEEIGLNGHTATDSGVRSDAFSRRGDVHVTVDREVAASISEAMTTALHESLDTLSLDPVPSDAHESSVKGKEPATEGSRTEVENSPSNDPETGPSELSLPSSRTLSESRERDAARDKSPSSRTVI
ncbi:hypothetical protein F5Y00DRAFT_205851 [Daldinia vernicosa]|uniref:uncharacterized protein n=1 Tax=Daldinia vernicosa TaxID=114800 RepID=UPI0020081B57|nr:uncharacterized protein F5Y00DRAFT_205851 [Daldinia vernicosa]KAI0852045.1 hypothetical protein F5Y00DRAFT_205851 [Daldinia vernicosa]